MWFAGHRFSAPPTLTHNAHAVAKIFALIHGIYSHLSAYTGLQVIYKRSLHATPLNTTRAIFTVLSSLAFRTHCIAYSHIFPSLTNMKCGPLHSTLIHVRSPPPAAYLFLILSTLSRSSHLFPQRILAYWQMTTPLPPPLPYNGRRCNAFNLDAAQSTIAFSVSCAHCLSLNAIRKLGAVELLKILFPQGQVFPPLGSPTRQS